MADQPSLFIGSSSEGIDVARAIAVQLSDCAETTVWPDLVFLPTRSYLESLLRALDNFEFAVLVFTPDDLERLRGHESFVPRDNVVFELGLFLGRLGPDRTFVVRSPKATRVASDLRGVQLLSYDERSDGNLVAAVNTPCVAVRKIITEVRQAMEANPVRSLLGDWQYESEAPDLKVHGEAHVELIGDELKIHGARTELANGTGEPIETGIRRFVWNSKWAAVFNDRKFRFVWYANDGKEWLEGYCTVNLIGDPPEKMEGSFYMLPPRSQAGHIRFSRLIEQAD